MRVFAPGYTLAFLLFALSLVSGSTVIPLSAQVVATDSNSYLTYKFRQPSQPAIDHAIEALHVFDGEFVKMVYQRGDSIAQIIGRVRGVTWKNNPEVVGGDPGDSSLRASFGPVQEYLKGDPRFRILVIPSMCIGCDGVRSIIFVPFADSAVWIVEGRRRPPPGP